MHKLTVYIPETHLASVKDAIFAAGAGRYAAYDCCCWQVLGEGQFRPLEGSNPAIGRYGVLEKIPEYRVEAICEDTAIPGIIAAIRAAHPYEEPAFVFTPVRMQ